MKAKLLADYWHTRLVKSFFARSKEKLISDQLTFVDQSHSSVERAGILAGVRIRLLPTDELFSLHGETLKSAMEEDKAKGFIPFFVLNFI